MNDQIDSASTSDEQVAKPSELMYRQAISYARDLSRIYAEERSKREKLEVAYQLLNSVFNNTPDSILVLDYQRRIQQTNQRFQDLVETIPAILEGQPIDAFLPEKVVRALDALEADPTAPAQVDCILTRPVQRAMTAWLARVSAGKLSGWIITLHDQSERKRMEYQKGEFVNIAAHELFTPLGQVLGYAELLRDSLLTDLPEQGKNKIHVRYLESILKGGQRLKTIVDELVQFAVLNTGHTEPDQITEFRLRDLLNALDTDLKRVQLERKVTLHIDQPDPDLLVILNGALLRTALYQIVLNGLNFNKPGGYVRIHVIHKDDQVRIAVSDSGIGIAKTSLTGIFQPFIQVEDHNTRTVNGLGLGLSIARRSLAALSGSLTVESVLNEGTTFHLEFPRQQKSAGETVHVR